MLNTMLTLFDTDRYHEFYRAGLWRDETLYDLVRAYSERAPERIALRSTDADLTYRMLLSHVDAFANDLARRCHCCLSPSANRVCRTTIAYMSQGDGPAHVA